MKRIGNTNSFLKTVPVTKWWGGASYSVEWQDVIVHGGVWGPCRDKILHFKLCDPKTDEDKELGVMIKHSEEYADELIEKREPYEWNGRLWKIHKFTSEELGKWVYIDEMDRQKKEYAQERRRFMEKVQQEKEYYKLTNRIKRGIAKMNQMKRIPYVSGVLSMMGVILVCVGGWVGWLIISDLIS